MQVDASDVQLLAGSVTDGALSYTAERSFADNALSADPNIVNKYRMAADACARGISAVFSGVCPGASVRALCELGDGIVAAEVGQNFKWHYLYSNDKMLALE